MGCKLESIPTMQIVKVHQETVDNYLEDIILSTIERSADEQARKEMQVIAEKIDKAAQMTEAKFETLIFFMICL